jgi:hypothetical protein
VQAQRAKLLSVGELEVAFGVELVGALDPKAARRWLAPGPAQLPRQLGRQLAGARADWSQPLRETREANHGASEGAVRGANSRPGQ